ncbi:hypothetical protein [Flavobacterium sp.]|uniref:hypothetical protein n=1 Tax=Flavobacterium sp. TaxID=239 RepID=UPI004034328F
MKETELEYYYPYRIDKAHSYRALNNSINENFDEERYYSFFSRISGGVDEVDGYFQNDFSSWSLWKNSGRNIFSFSSDLLLMLEKTDVDDISYDMFSLPYDNFYLSLKGLGLYADSEQEINIDGVYVHLERMEMEAIPKSKRNPDISDDDYQPEYKLLIYFHFVGDFEKIVKARPDDLVFDEEILLSWSYALSFATDEQFLTVGDAIKHEIKKFEGQLWANFPDNAEKQKNLLNYYKSFVDQTVRVLVNSLLYLSQPREKLDIEKEYPANLPFNFNRKLNFAKTNNTKNKIEKKINETGFSKILFFGRNENRNINEYTDYHKKSIHWRRGHWRKQPYGEGLQKNRMVWIRPVLINKAEGEVPKGHVYDVQRSESEKS